MIPDHNHDGKIDRYDMELENILMEEDEEALEEAAKGSPKYDAWAFIIVLGIMFIGFLIICHKFGIH